MKPTQELVEKLFAEHGKKLIQIVSDQHDVTVLVRRPGRGEYLRFRAAFANESKKLEAAEKLLMSNMLFPSKQEFLDILEDLPGLGDRMAGELIDEMGLGKESAEKKPIVIP